MQYDLVLLADTVDLLKLKIRKYKAGMEETGLRLSMGKTKVMRCQDGASCRIRTGKCPCAVCARRVLVQTPLRLCHVVHGATKDVAVFRVNCAM